VTALGGLHATCDTPRWLGGHTQCLCKACTLDLFGKEVGATVGVIEGGGRMGNLGDEGARGLHELVEDHPGRQHAVIVLRKTGRPRVELRQAAAHPQGLVAVVAGHAVGQPVGVPGQDGLPDQPRPRLAWAETMEDSSHCLRPPPPPTLRWGGQGQGFGGE